MRWGLPVEDRFWSHVEKRGPDECWLWTGTWSPTADAGGPSFRISKTPSVKTRAHRYSWQIANKRFIPDKRIVAQTCNNKDCVNPAHLYLDSTEARKELNKKAKAKQKAATRAFINAAKKSCLRCGFSEHPVALQFHHRNRSEKLFEISKSLGKSLAAIAAEIAKCDVLCANCHAIVEDELRRAA